MKNSWNTPARKYFPGMGNAVADRTINRLKPDGERETWGDVAHRVSLGNSMLAGSKFQQGEFESMNHHLRQASLLMSGRHLQHGDSSQITRNQEILTNCSTAANSCILFYLLLNGSGVGRTYDDDMMILDWSRNMPDVHCYIREDHPDVLSGEIPYKNFAPGSTIHYYRVLDSREGWAKAIEQIEFLTWQGNDSNSTLVLDFSDIRHRNTLIKGMQNRPASGPGPIMTAIENIAKIKNSAKDPWEATMHVDHFLSECVLVGGARRAARMATKTWRDKSIISFINVKKGGILWSSNNSVTVDEEFWNGVKLIKDKLDRENIPLLSDLAEDILNHLSSTRLITPTERKAYEVFVASTRASYFDKTGEPGFINVDKLTQKNEGLEVLLDGNYAESVRFKLDSRSLGMTSQLVEIFARKEHMMIVNPCGEVPLTMLGGYCTIADVVPYFAQNDNDAVDAFRTAVRSLIRVNTMDCLYSKEVKRTNRIGVGFTGLFEYAWTRFGFGWKDMVDEKVSLEFWQMMATFSRAVVDEATTYAKQLGVPTPHTSTIVKPAGCATLDTTVKTVEGITSIENIFKNNGYSVDDLKKYPDGTWLEITAPTIVIDENNDQKSVTKLYVNGIKTVFEIEFEDGYKVKLTGNHKLKTLTGWKRVDELTESDDIVQF